MPPEIMEVSRKTMSFYEAPSQKNLNEIISAQNDVIQWVKRNGASPAGVLHAERIFLVFVSFAWKKHGYNGSPYPEKKMNHVVDSILKGKPASPGDLDFLWAAFSATGNEQYLDTLVDAADSRDAGIAGAAKWSLNANYRQHNAVRKYFGHRPEKRKKIIQKPPTNGIF